MDGMDGIICHSHMTTRAIAVPTNILYLVTSKYAIFFLPHIVFRGWKVFLIDLYPLNSVKRIAGNKYDQICICEKVLKRKYFDNLNFFQIFEIKIALMSPTYSWTLPSVDVSMKQSSSDTTTSDIKYTQKSGNSVQDTYELSSLNSFNLIFFSSDSQNIFSFGK